MDNYSDYTISLLLIIIFLASILITLCVGIVKLTAIEEALHFPQIATTNTSYIKAPVVNIFDGGFEVTETEKQ